MVAPSRLVMLAIALLTFSALPAAAQQAGSNAAGTPLADASSEVAPPAVDAATNLERMVRQLGQEVQRLSQAARDTARTMTEENTPIVITVDQLAAIAGGALAGAFAADLLLHGGMVTLAGALLGGVIGHWIYTQPSPATASAS